MAVAKVRLDQLLVARGMVESRAKAQALIMAGKVSVGTQALTKPGQMVAEDLDVVMAEKPHPWVSRGGMKLAQAITHFGLDPAGVVAADIGASTGGFTDVLLTHGAAKVFAVDVGHGQLDWKLRNDPRVVVMEKVNARHLTTEMIAEPLDWVVCDASFISLKTVLPAVLGLTKPTAVLVALIKPQFEVGKGQVGKGGVVRDPELHQAVCEEMAAWLPTLPGGWEVAGIVESPITGPEGNREFLLVGRRGA